MLRMLMHEIHTSLLVYKLVVADVAEPLLSPLFVDALPILLASLFS